MKIRFVIAATMALAACHVPTAHAVTQGQRGMLPNFDARETAAAGPAKTALAPTAVRTAAEAKLAARVPGVKVSRDFVLGTPRLVSAPKGFLTGPNGMGKAVSQVSLLAVPADDPHRALKAFINEHSAVFGHDSSVLSSAKVTRDSVAEHSGMRSTVWQQTHLGIPVFDGLLTSHVSAQGELVSVADHFVPNAAAAAQNGTAGKLAAANSITAIKAVILAAASAGVEMAESTFTVTRGPEGPEQYQTLESSAMVVPAYAKLVWLPLDANTMRLCWRVVANVRPMERYLMVLDAETGDVLVRRSLTISLKDITFKVFTNDSPSPFSPSHPTVLTTQPELVEPVVVKTSALDTNASPFGWINDSNTRLSGNNAVAYLDRDLDFLPDGPLLDGGANRDFQYPIDLTGNPSGYGSGSAAQLFWRANWYHDRLYQLGFTEAAGNYQVTNFDRGGLDRDPVMCLAQAGSLDGWSDNAFFMPAPDGEPGYVAMFTWSGPTPNRDGSLDSEIVIHELTHGLSTRLVGSGVGISQLQSGGLGEGWSDFYALALLSEPTDDPAGNYAMGGYVTYQMMPRYEDNYYFGVRRYPYTTDMKKNPFTLKDIDPTQASVHQGIPVSSIFGGTDADEVHNMGEVWCAALWEVRAAIISRVGWAEGNELTLQLVTDGMKLCPENPNFIEARDAIIQADQVYTGGAMYEDIWTAFAKRGYGFGATTPRSTTARGVSENFDLPPDVVVGPPDGILEIKFSPAPGSLVFAGEQTPFFVKVSDSLGVTNANVQARLNGVSLQFRNDGTEPDAFARDNTYSTTFRAPTNGISITLSVIVSAPGKTSSTNEVTYFLITPPVNDAFALATKVPSTGSNYFTSNKKATIEPGEPKHAGVSSVAASLWWNYIPPVNGEVLVDSGGSEFTTVVAVYTNSTFTNLQAVASAVGSSSISGRQGAFLRFNGRAGVTYRIAVASRDSRGTGTVRLRIGSGGQPDTNSPVTIITAPASGYVTTTNRVILTGTAVDGDPSPSGIKLLSVNITTLPSASDDVNITLYPRLSFDGPASTNWSSNVGLRPGLNRISVSALDYAGNRSAPAVIEVLYRLVDPDNDFFATATALATTSRVYTVNTLQATKEVGEPNHAGTIGGKSAWWYFDAPTDGVLSLSTSNSVFDTVMAVYTGTKVSQLTLVNANDDATAGSGFSQLAQPVKGGTRYYIAVDGYDAASGVAYLSASFSSSSLFVVTVNSGPGGQVPLTSYTVQSNGVLTVSATPDQTHTFDMWDGSVVALVNPLAIVVRSNMTINARFAPKGMSDGFELGNLSGLGWTSGGHAAWTVQTNRTFQGTFAAQSGNISHGQTSSLVLTANFRAGTGSFAYRVDSEPVWDRLNFYMDGTLLQYWSGTTPWTIYSFPITAGAHTLEWRYSKDNVNNSGADSAFIDSVNLPLSIPVNSLTPAQLSLNKQFDGSYYLNVQGQPNQVYIVQVSTNLVSWSGISTNIAVNGSLRVLDTQSKTGNARYYRAVTPQ